MATTMIQSNITLSEEEEERFVYYPKVHEEYEDYEDWVHEQNMDAEFNMVEYHTCKTRKISQNLRDKKLMKSKQDDSQKELYKQKLKEMEAAKQLKIQKNKERKAEENLRNLERKDKQDVKDIGLDENQYDKDKCGEVNWCLVKDNWEDCLGDD